MKNFINFVEDENLEYENIVRTYGFSYLSIRKWLFRKVAAILVCQFLVQLVFFSSFLFNEGVRLWTFRNPALVWVAYAVVMVTLLTLASCDGMKKKYPWNFILLGLLTVAESFISGTVCATYKADEVILAVWICAMTGLALTFFAIRTQVDFTKLIKFSFVPPIFGIVVIFIPGNTVRLVMASLGVFSFSVHLILYIQGMMFGKHKYFILPEEYSFAALNIYVDIVNIFMCIRAIIGINYSRSFVVRLVLMGLYDGIWGMLIGIFVDVVIQLIS